MEGGSRNEIQQVFEGVEERHPASQGCPLQGLSSGKGLGEEQV